MTGAHYADIELDLLGALGEAVIATDLHGAIIFWNRAAESLYGWASEDALGRGILDVTPTPLSRDEAAAIFADLLQGKTWSANSKPATRTDAISASRSPTIRCATGTASSSPLSASLALPKHARNKPQRARRAPSSPPALSARSRAGLRPASG